MELKETVFIDEFDEKLFRIKLIEMDEDKDKKAVLTHYIHNRKHDVSQYFEEEAILVGKEILKSVYSDIEFTENQVREAFQYGFFKNNEIPFPSVKNPKFQFIDLFAGIGGFRLALQNLGGHCVYSSEWDKEAKRTYWENFGDTPFGDIKKESTKKFIPDGFDILCAGFPCQAFSIAGKRGGFEDTRGTLFFEVAEIIRRKRPKAIFLENVKGLKSHDKSKTLNTILNVLRQDLGYFVPDPKILNAKDFGVPQNRERIFIVGFRNDLGISDFEYPKPISKKPKLNDVLEKNEVSVKYYLSETYLDTLRKHKERHKSKGNGFGYEIIASDEIANAVVCGGMGRERNLVKDFRLKDFTPVTNIRGEVNKEGIRKMTPREWARLQGFPDNFIIQVSDTQAYKQFGNSVAVPAIQATANEILKKLNSL